MNTKQMLYPPFTPSGDQHSTYFPPYVANLNEPWRDFLHLGEERIYPRGAEIIPSNTNVHGIWFIESGLLRYSHISGTTGREKVMFYAGPGMTFGETPAFDKKCLDGTFSAAVETKTFYFPLSFIYRTIADKHPHLLLNLLESITSKLRLFSCKLENLALNSVTQYVASFICHVAEHKNELSPWLAQLSQEETARLLGISMTSLTRVIRWLKDENIVRKFTRKNIDIADWDRLREIATYGD